VQENNHNFPFDQLKEVEERNDIPPLYEEAKSFLYSHKWCKKVEKGWYDEDFNILDKLGVFLFKIEPINDDVDNHIWIIVGDLPSVYLDASVETGKEALEAYCELMSEWVNNVLKGQSLEESYPVDAQPTEESAELLKKRIAFIKRELLIEAEG
jgi:hypothetical protein